MGTNNKYQKQIDQYQESKIKNKTQKKIQSPYFNKKSGSEGKKIQQRKSPPNTFLLADTQYLRTLIKQVLRKVWLTIFLHVDSETFREPAGLALVSASHIHDTAVGLLAHVVQVPVISVSHSLMFILIVVFLLDCSPVCRDSNQVLVPTYLYAGLRK